MVKNGLKGPKASSEEVARLTIQTLKRAVPACVPGVFFLSGKFNVDEDNEETACIHLSTMRELFKDCPWSVAFSFGKALQKTTIVTWMGKQENEQKAQQALISRANACGNASEGTYKAGTCASVGTDGNIKQVLGAY